jgi:hypothetical protein
VKRWVTLSICALLVTGCRAETSLFLTVSGVVPGAAQLHVRLVGEDGPRPDSRTDGAPDRPVVLPAVVVVYPRERTSRIGIIVWVTDTGGSILAHASTTTCIDVIANARVTTTVALLPAPDGWSSSGEGCRCDPAPVPSPMCPTGGPRGPGDAGVADGLAPGRSEDTGESPDSGSEVLPPPDSGPEVLPPPVVDRPVFTTGSFTKATAAAPVSQTVLHGLGVRPRALILWTVGKTSSTVGPGYVFAMGLVDQERAGWSAAHSARDGVAGSTSASRRMMASALSVVQYGNVLLAEADVSAWDTGRFTLTWTSNDANPYIVHFLAIGGASVSSKVVEWQAAAAATTKPITGLGFRPSLAIHLHAGSAHTAAMPASEGNAFFGLGVMVEGGTQWANTTFALDMNSLVNVPPGRAQRSDATLYMVRPTLASPMPETAKVATASSFDSDGFTTGFSVTNTMTTRIVSLALAGVAARAGRFDKIVTPARSSQVVTGLGFRPGAVLLASFQDVAQPSAGVTEARLGIGASDGLHHQSVAYSDTFNVRASNVKGKDSTTAAFTKMNNGLGIVDAEAELASFDPDGFTLTWTVNDAIPTEITYLGLGAPVPEIVRPVEKR